jgi:hypothetical protein
LRELSRLATTSPPAREPSWSHHPLQSLGGRRSSGPSGFPLPVRPWHSRAPGPSGLPSSVRAQGRDSLGDPLMGFDPPSWLVPKSPPIVSRRGHLSWGSRRPFSARGGESPRPAGSSTTSRSSVPDCSPGWCAGGSQAAGYGAARRFSQPLSGVFLSPPSHHFQMGGARGVLPTGVCSSREASPTRRRRRTLLTLFPRVARAPVLGGGIRGRAVRCLGCSAQRLSSSSGSSSSHESVRVVTTV